MNPVIIIGGALLLYLFWQSMSLSLPSDAAYMASFNAGTAYAVPQSFAIFQSGVTGGIAQGPATTATTYLYYGPSEQTYYLVTTAPTQAQVAAGAALSATSTPTGSTTGSGVTPTGQLNDSLPSAVTNTTLTAGGQPATYNTPGGGTAPTPTTLAGLWTAIQQWAASDSNFTTVGGVLQGPPGHWNFYVNFIWPNTPTGWAGAWPPDFNAILTTALPGLDVNQPITASRWWSTVQPALQQGGLSGLRGLSGLGAITPFAVRGRGGWAA
jgi:hypothetical protein